MFKTVWVLQSKYVFQRGAKISIHFLSSVRASLANVVVKPICGGKNTSEAKKRWLPVALCGVGNPPLESRQDPNPFILPVLDYGKNIPLQYPNTHSWHCASELWLAHCDLAANRLLINSLMPRDTWSNYKIYKFMYRI